MKKTLIKLKTLAVASLLLCAVFASCNNFKEEEEPELYYFYYEEEPEFYYFYYREYPPENCTVYVKKGNEHESFGEKWQNLRSEIYKGF